MKFYNPFYRPKRLMRKRISNKNKIYFMIALILVLKSSSLESSDCYELTNVNDFLYIVNYLSLIELNTREYSVVDLKFEEEVISLNCEEAVVNEERKNMYELDFSDMPNNDGSIESALEICRYTREMVKDIPNEYKLDYVLKHFLMNDEEFDVIQAVVGKEAKPGDYRYEDSFAVITDIYNRMRSYTKCGYVQNWTGKDYVTMYDHVTAPHQFQVYNEGDYKELLGSKDGEHYQAVLDFLFIADRTPEYMHICLDFLSSGYKSSKRMQFVTGGNNFSNFLSEEDVIPISERYYYNDNMVVYESNNQLIMLK